ncbi:MAG TPA: glycosyltransferase, partial [Flavisolibacter sp.]|nr:glycosyltransferase [Flavisolibacter sp.]
HTTEYGWHSVGVERTIIFDREEVKKTSVKKLSLKLAKALSDKKPDAVAINGWSHIGALAALYWCRENGIPAIVMSESAAEDDLRVQWKEKLKRKLIRLFGAGLVGGGKHVSYLKELGMEQENIFTGYDVVDNQYFQDTVNKVREGKDIIHGPSMPSKFFLVSSRFIYKKNLPFIIKAFAKYRQQITENKFDLVILGDGPLRSILEQMIKDLHLENAVHLPGFIQYEELPFYYAHASCLIHASTTEQWGLVVNEAMASGLPVIVSENCGCVPELVCEGVNGFTFNPLDQKALTRIMLSISAPSCELSAMGAKSKEIIKDWQPIQFGKGLHQAAISAINKIQAPFGLVEKFIIKSLMYTKK